MIAANKNYLKANLGVGTINIQEHLISLYSNNFSAIGTQAALIAGFAFAVVSTHADFSTNSAEGLGYIYYSFFTICFVAALCTLSQATIVVMFAPSLALTGSTEDAVADAVNIMHSQQKFVFKLGSISISALFVGAVFQSFALYSPGIAAVCTFVYIIGYLVLVISGINTYNLLHLKGGKGNSVSRPHSHSQTQGKGKSAHTATATATGLYNSIVNTGLGGDAMSQSGHHAIEDEAASAALQREREAREVVRLRARGILWKRSPVEEGGTFLKHFAVLDSGRLDLYASEEDYRQQLSPINKRPYKLWQFNLETDTRRFARTAVSLEKAMKKAMLVGGSEDFTVRDLMNNKDHDLAFAATNFRFALVPKITSELQAAETFEFLAHDEKTFKLWTDTVGRVVHAYDDIISFSPSMTMTMQTTFSAGVKGKVEDIVKAANA